MHERITHEANMTGAKPKPLPRSLARDIAIAFGPIAIIAALLIFGGGSASGRNDRGAAIGTRYRNSNGHLEAAIPAGWQAIYRPINGVLYPPQVLAAASFRVRVPHELKGCYPGKVLGQMPADGVLVQIFEYTPRVPGGRPVRVPHLPPRPPRFRYSDAAYGLRVRRLQLPVHLRAGRPRLPSPGLARRQDR